MSCASTFTRCAAYCFVAVLHLAGCDRPAEIKSPTASSRTGATTATKTNATHPVSADTERVFALVIDLAEDNAKREAIRRSYADWLNLRQSHCGAMEKVATQDATLAANCYAGLDRQQRDTLNQIRLALLLSKPAPRNVAPANANVSIAFKSPMYQNRVAVAPSGTLAAVSSPNGEIDLYDLISGQLLRNLPGERKATRVDFSANGRLLYVSKQQSRGMKVLDAYSGEELTGIDEIFGPYVLIDGGRSIVYADGAALGIYDVLNRKPRGQGLFAKSAINALAVDHSTRTVATASRDGWISVWQIAPDGDGTSPPARPLAEARLYGNNEFPQELEFFQEGNKLFVVVSDRNLKTVGLETITLPQLQRTWTTAMQGVYFRGVMRLAGTNRFALITNTRSGPGSVLTVLDPAADTAMMVEESRQFITAALLGEARSKLLLLNSQGMWSREIPSDGRTAPVASVMAEIVGIGALPSRTTSVPPNVPMAPKLLPNTRIEAIGVYEGALPGGQKRQFRQHAAGSVTVNVGSMSTPVALVLSSYEPVNWIVRSAGARVTHILVSGNADSKVIGVGGADVMRIGGAFAYDLKKTGALNALVMQYLGRGIDRFQGLYTGSTFSVGPQPSTANVHKWTDSEGRTHFGDRPPR